MSSPAWLAASPASLMAALVSPASARARPTPASAETRSRPSAIWPVTSVPWARRRRSPVCPSAARRPATAQNAAALAVSPRSELIPASASAAWPDIDQGIQGSPAPVSPAPMNPSAAAAAARHCLAASAARPGSPAWASAFAAFPSASALSPWSATWCASSVTCRASVAASALRPGSPGDARVTAAPACATALSAGSAMAAASSAACRAAAAAPAPGSGAASGSSRRVRWACGCRVTGEALQRGQGVRSSR